MSNVPRICANHSWLLQIILATFIRTNRLAIEKSDCKFDEQIDVMLFRSVIDLCQCIHKKIRMWPISRFARLSSSQKHIIYYNLNTK